MHAGSLLGAVNPDSRGKGQRAVGKGRAWRRGSQHKHVTDLESANIKGTRYLTLWGFLLENETKTWESRAKS